MKPKPPAKLGQRRGSVGSAAGRSSVARAGSAPRALLIGVGTADISPPHPELLTPTGMGRRVRTRGVLDPLRVEAMAISAGGELAFVTTSDLRTIPMEKGAPEESGPSGRSVSPRTFPAGGGGAKEIQRKIARRCGCPEHRILLSAVHNHCSSPDVYDSSPQAKAALRKANQKILDGFVEACAKAQASLRPAEIAASTVHLAEPVGLNRRMLLSNGTCVNCWGAGPMIPFGHKAVAPAGPNSARVDILAVREVGQEAPFAILTSYATHPHLYELPYFSGEFPGALKRRMEAACPGAVALHANSTGGDNDLHDVHPMPDYEPQQVRWFRESAELLGDRFIRSVLPAIPKAGFQRPAELRSEYYSSEAQETSGSYRLTILGAIALGDFAFLSMPGELFVSLGLDLLARSPFAHTFLMGYNGSREGYAPPPLAFEQGSYEVMRGPGPESDPPGAPLGSIRARPWTGQRIIARSLEILGRLKEGRGR